MVFSFFFLKSDQNYHIFLWLEKFYLNSCLNHFSYSLKVIYKTEKKVCFQVSSLCVSLKKLYNYLRKVSFKKYAIQRYRLIFLLVSISLPTTLPSNLAFSYLSYASSSCLIQKSSLIHQSTDESGIPPLYSLMCMRAKSLQSWSTLCNPKDHSLPGSCPWDSPDKNTGVDFHALLQGIFLTQGLNPCLLEGQAGSLPLVPPGKSLYSLGAQ